MPRNSIVGTGGWTMPVDLYLKKRQYTCMPEDTDAFNKYSRNVLKDMRCDEPLWEDEYKRTDTHSEEKLNIFHHGKRSEKVPDLPDGTFLDWEFTQHETRGPDNQPDWKTLKQDKAFRNRYYKYRNDDDHTQGQKNLDSRQADEAKREAFDYISGRLNIFSTSQEGANPHSSVKFDSRHYSDLVEANRNPLPIDGMTLMNRCHIAKELEKLEPIGWNSTTDHEYKIAYYGSHKAHKRLDQIDPLKNRSNTYMQHELVEALPDASVPRHILMDMIDITKQKINGIQSLTGVAYGVEKTTAESKRKRIQEDWAKSRGLSQKSAVDPAHAQVGEKMHHQNSKKFENTKWDANQYRKSVFNPQLAESIASKTRHLKFQDYEDLRNQVLESATSDAIFLDAKTKPVGKPLGSPTHARHIQEEAQASTESEVTIKHYGVLPFTKLKERAQVWAPKLHNAGDIAKGDARYAEQRNLRQMTTMDRHTNVEGEPQSEQGITSSFHRVKPGAVDSNYMVDDFEHESMMEL
jgi:hypothetical protein